ncbi:uncharacterized protein EI90DRAFT_3187079 [Cantharellus anzutake]|uniref:uncharacterized protein n=1 Tax=Cantharellus anzutake TaxID=1750568 RepID=UPI001906E3BF|nr:uncharacterized protein EI90DRAFT_3187079 [Cantharellus anzutake]KAF8332624.1 hypothetical protein EI90DRAFT_3187079 [Cantharellus anzutake]
MGQWSGDVDNVKQPYALVEAGILPKAAPTSTKCGSNVILWAVGNLPHFVSRVSLRIRRSFLSRGLLPPSGWHTHKIGTIQRRLAWPLHKDDTL